MAHQTVKGKSKSSLQYSLYIVGNDAKTVDTLTKHFASMSDRVEATANLKQALKKIGRFTFDIVILLLPQNRKQDGLRMVKRIRNVSDVPMLIIAEGSPTAKMDAVEILDSGADDYITMPFALAELTARVENIAKRRKDLVFKNTKVRALNLQLDIKHHVAEINGRLVSLTKMEYLILQYLLLNKNTLIQKTQIEVHVIPIAKTEGTHFLNTHILHLRKKLGMNFSIKTIPQQGFIVGD